MSSVLLEGLKRYLREADLDKLASYTIGIIGAGGLGSNAAMTLARSGLRRFIISDMDKVEPSNLNRQYFFPEDIGKYKAEALKEKLLALDESLSVQTYVESIDEANFEKIYHNGDIIIEAVDAAETKGNLFQIFQKSYPNGEKLFVTASGLVGYGDSELMGKSSLGKHRYMVGDGKSSLDEDVPLAPKVIMAAAMEADVVLNWILGAKDRVRRKHMDNFFNTLVYALTDSKSSLGRSTVEVAEAMLKAGVKFIQYREKNKSMGEKYKEAYALRLLTRAYKATFIVNDHLDLALAVDADGVHMGQDDLPPKVVRQLLGPHKLLGISTHDTKQYEAVIKLNDEALENSELPVVDYIGVGPVFATKTKVDVVDPVGFAYPEYAVQRNAIPFVAIGGIKLHNLRNVLDLGVKQIAMVTEITGARDIEAVIREIEKLKQI